MILFCFEQKKKMIAATKLSTLPPGASRIYKGLISRRQMPGKGSKATNRKPSSEHVICIWRAIHIIETNSSIALCLLYNHHRQNELLGLLFDHCDPFNVIFKDLSLILCRSKNSTVRRKRSPETLQIDR